MFSSDEGYSRNIFKQNSFFTFLHFLKYFPSRQTKDEQWRVLVIHWKCTLLSSSTHQQADFLCQSSKASFHDCLVLHEALPFQFLKAFITHQFGWINGIKQRIAIGNNLNFGNTISTNNFFPHCSNQDSSINSIRHGKTISTSFNINLIDQFVISLTFFQKVLLNQMPHPF